MYDFAWQDNGDDNTINAYPTLWYFLDFYACKRVSVLFSRV